MYACVYIGRLVKRSAYFFKKTLTVIICGLVLLCCIFVSNKNINNMKATEIKNYLIENYGECRHDHVKVSKALKGLAKKTSLQAWDLFHLVFENQPIDEAYTHSYGFHTAEGRYLINEFQSIYYSL